MMVPPKHPKMVIFSRKANSCWVILGNFHIPTWISLHLSGSLTQQRRAWAWPWGWLTQPQIFTTRCASKWGKSLKNRPFDPKGKDWVVFPTIFYFFWGQCETGLGYTGYTINKKHHWTTQTTPSRHTFCSKTSRRKSTPRGKARVGKNRPGKTHPP